MTRPILVSFDLCPFVQRSVIMLREKGVDFDVVYIDLANKPDWVLAISPLGKVPLLRVGETVLFESAVINEYLDETHPPTMMPADPLERAQARAWVIFAGEILGLQFRWMTAKEERARGELEAQMTSRLAHFVTALGEEPFHGGATLGVVDAAMAPAMMRFQAMDGFRTHRVFEALPRLGAYADALMACEAVKGSVPESFEPRLRAAIEQWGG